MTIYEFYKTSNYKSDLASHLSFLEYYYSKLFEQFKPNSLLMVGTGNGHDLRLFKDYLPETKFVGAESDLTAFNTNSPFANDFDLDIIGANCRTEEGVRLLSEGMQEFDVIIDNEVFDISQKIEMMARMIPLLRFGGIYIMSRLRTPNYDMDCVKMALDQGFRITLHNLKTIKNREYNALLVVSRV